MVTKIPELHLSNFYYGTTDPTGTTRVNINANLYATNLVGPLTGNADTSSSTSAIAGISTYTGTTDPTGTTRINIDGYVYATKVYNAVYNDYAECFNNDKLVYRDARNRIVELDDNGNTVLATENSTNVIGVVSDSYGHMLGGVVGLF